MQNNKILKFPSSNSEKSFPKSLENTFFKNSSFSRRLIAIIGKNLIKFAVKNILNTWALKATKGLATVAINLFIRKKRPIRKAN